MTADRPGELDPAWILYSDNHLLAINKPAGMLTQPSSTGRDNLETRAKAWIKREKEKLGNVYLHSIHRLDRQVSGVVLFARTSKALSRLNKQMRERRIVKIYHALTSTRPFPTQGMLEHALKHGDHCAEIVGFDDPGAKPARLHYRLLKDLAEGLHLLEIRLETGRYHQIRAQLAAAGCPIEGDQRYGGSGPFAQGIGLHHREMRVRHPVNQEELHLIAPYPNMLGIAN